MSKVKCEHCDYEWDSRVEEPKACPRCKRRFDYPFFDSIQSDRISLVASDGLNKGGVK